MQQIIPFIWFDGDAEEAVQSYVALFPNSTGKTSWRSTAALVNRRTVRTPVRWRSS